VPCIIVSSPGPSNPKTIHLVFPASPLNTLNLGVRVISGLLVSYDCGEVFVNGIQKISGLLVSYDCGEVFVNGIQKISGLLLFSLYNTGFMVYGDSARTYSGKSSLKTGPTYSSSR
jgi:hypothetical protein